VFLVFEFAEWVVDQLLALEFEQAGRLPEQVVLQREFDFESLAQPLLLAVARLFGWVVIFPDRLLFAAVLADWLADQLSVLQESERVVPVFEPAQAAAFQ
jgi:hypothetical protein